MESHLEKYHSLSPVLWAWQCPHSDPEAASRIGEAWFLFLMFCCMIASGTRDGQQGSESFQEKVLDMPGLPGCIKELHFGCSWMTSPPGCIKALYLVCSLMEWAASDICLQGPNAHQWSPKLNSTYYTCRMKKQTMGWGDGPATKGQAYNRIDKKQIGATEEEVYLNVKQVPSGVGRIWLKGKFLMCLPFLEALAISCKCFCYYCSLFMLTPWIGWLNSGDDESMEKQIPEYSTYLAASLEFFLLVFQQNYLKISFCNKNKIPLNVLGVPRGLFFQ